MYSQFIEWFKKDKVKHITIILIGVLLFLSIVLPMLVPVPPAPKEMSYKKFETMVAKQEVKDVTINLKNPSFTFRDKKSHEYVTANPKTDQFKESLLKADVKVYEIDPAQNDKWFEIFRSTFGTILVIGVLLYFSKSMYPTNGKQKPTEIKPSTTFAHIAGNDEAKEEMEFLVDFLKNPKKYKRMGAKLPKGVIFYGSPGTGKTLTAKAIAGEAGVPFFSASGSDFIEKFVGVGASRVRDLFAEARKKAPCIIFIDELDAVGSNRDLGFNSEQRQTINAILNEMDGFESAEGVVVIGATNRMEDLDPAFIRPGRFDKHIAIALPDMKGRLEILKIHARNKPLAPSVNLEELAKMTIGMSGAYLEAIMNESAILATTRNKEVITQEELDDAFFKLVMKGHKKRSGDERQQDEIKLVAWHEAGHAIATKLLTANEVPKVTIVSSTSGAGGVTFITPKKMGLLSKDEIRNQIKVLYAGRVAEYLLLGSEDKVTTGASQDIKQATRYIADFINEYGMSSTFGMLRLSSLGNSPLQENPLFVEEAIKLSKHLYEDTVAFLTENKRILQAVAEALIEKESLSEEELETIIHISQSFMERE